jgi:hypothetical protein
MYLQYHASREGTKNMLPFYALSVLYLLSTGVMVCDILMLVIDQGIPVSKNKPFFKKKPWRSLVAQNVGGTVIYRLIIVEGTLFGCCDFISQSILVRTTQVAYSFGLFIHIFKDIPLLDCVASKYPCRGHSLNVSLCFLRFVGQSIFVHLL